MSKPTNILSSILTKAEDGSLRIFKKKLTNNNKVGAFGAIIIIFILSIHINLYIKVSRLQLEIKKIRTNINESQKVYEIRNIEFENKIGYQTIRKRAEEELEMEISEDIRYFKINEH